MRDGSAPAFDVAAFVETAIADTLRAATAAGRWRLARGLLRELRARRRGQP